MSYRSHRAIAAFLKYIGGAAFLLPLTFNSVHAGAEEAQRLAADIVVIPNVFFAISYTYTNILSMYIVTFTSYVSEF